MHCVNCGIPLTPDGTAHAVSPAEVDPVLCVAGTDSGLAYGLEGGYAEPCLEEGCAGEEAPWWAKGGA